MTTAGQRSQAHRARQHEFAPHPANDDRKSAIVTIERKSRFGDAPDLTPEEHPATRRGRRRAVARTGGSGDRQGWEERSRSAGSSSPATKPAIVVTARKRRSDGPHLPMELPLSRKPVERDGDDYKRMKAAMARRLRGE